MTIPFCEITQGRHNDSQKVDLCSYGGSKIQISLLDTRKLNLC